MRRVITNFLSVTSVRPSETDGVRGESEEDVSDRDVELTEETLELVVQTKPGGRSRQDTVTGPAVEALRFVEECWGIEVREKVCAKQKGGHMKVNASIESSGAMLETLRAERLAGSVGKGKLAKEASVVRRKMTRKLGCFRTARTATPKN